MRALANIVVALFLTLPAIAAEAPPTLLDSVRYLVPITASDVPGAHGSLWTSELTVFNPAAASLPLSGRFCPESELSLCVATIEVPQNASTRVFLHPTEGRDGAFLYVPRAAAFAFTKQLRVRDISRDAENFGSEVPIVDVDSAFAATQRLLDVPTDPRYRALLRIYGPEDETFEVRVIVYPPSGDVPIENRVFTMNGKPTSELALNPSYLAVDPITDVVRAAGHARVRLEVTVVTFFPEAVSPILIWSFLSLTNNATNEFTVITPQR
ncbi:MAG TPA: hypothetical protein VGQ76_18760 [Thermoanaerobaculia bacterium]|jgi:hypothetical protein|nr:hypothetical protein [Thermoanaerobaculia bacterium]